METKFQYRNYKGILSERRVIVDSIEFLRNPGYDYQPGWFLSGYDLDKKNRRSFALTHIVLEVGKPSGITLKIAEQIIHGETP